MKFKDWMVTLAITALTVAAVWGSIRTTVESHESRIITLEIWKDKAIGELGNIDAKLDLILEANGIDNPKKHSRND